MRCPHCKETIDDDSLFCDQCGQELMFCPDCKVPKRGSECPLCGATLISGKEFFAAPMPKAAPKPLEYSETQRMPKPLTVPGLKNIITRSQNGQPLYLVGEGMKLELKEGSFGRKGGVYPEFSVCIYVSTRHGEFTRTPDGWTVLDYGSTNGTYLNGERLKTGTPYLIRQGDSLKISRLAFIIQ